MTISYSFVLTQEDFINNFIGGSDQLSEQLKVKKQPDYKSVKIEVKSSSDEYEKIENFIKSIIADFPDATSKDISAHCFASVKSTSRKMRKIKAIMDNIGIERDSTGGGRSPEKVLYMEKAPKYVPIRTAQDADKFERKKIK